MSIARHHTEWLSLIEISGPFVSLPVLSKVFPQGLDERDPEKARNLRSTFEAYQEAPNILATQLEWVKFVLSDTLSFYPEHLKEGQEIPPGLKADLLEHRETLRPDIAVVVPRTNESGEKVQQTQLLVSVYLKDQDLDAPIKGTHWKASPATRMAELLHASDVPLGLVTNGERWMLVYAPRGETTGFTSWYASLWFEEPKTLRAFHSLLSLQRVVGSADTLLSMLRESASDQQEVTDKLGRQVRDAVDVLVSAFSRLNIDAQGKLLEGISEKELYNAALTVMMRLVFLFCAEERGMLHLGKPLYDNNYAVSTLREQLQEDADQHGEEVLERRSDAWVRLLATFRAVYGGVTHEDLSLPAYGGSLFNPDRYAFLEGRPVGTEWTTSEAAPPKIDNRVVLHLLRSLQMLQDRDTREARRLSFRALDIEQIGHVYEGLLDHTAVRADKTMLGLEGSKKLEPMRSLEELEVELAKGETSFVKYLKETTGRSESALKKALNSVLLVDTHKLMISCHNDQSLFDRVLPFAGLLREDSFEMPLVILEGSVFVTSGTDRRSSGTHYTPRTLTEPVVKNTLEPLVYVGPAEGLPRAEWKLKTPREILALKVCDMAMGSGAFLTEACRYLAERLVEAWEQGEREHPYAIMVTPEGDFSRGIYSERILPLDPGERLTVARRLIADRCLYGVDINPMAVEMAKLSLWLSTIQKDRPFSFLDHALKCGDSILGISSFAEIENFSVRPQKFSQSLAQAVILEGLDASREARENIEKLPSESLEDIKRKGLLLQEAEKFLWLWRRIADSICGLETKGFNDTSYQIQRTIEIQNALDLISSMSEASPNSVADTEEPRRFFHWLLEFPEVILSGGFSAFVGNPPFLGGQRISGIYGEGYLAAIKSINPSARGTADFCSYFLMRSFALLRGNGALGVIATNTIAQGDSRASALDPIANNGSVAIYNVKSSVRWPGEANLEVAIAHIFKGGWVGSYILNDMVVPVINSHFHYEDQALASVYKLRMNSGIAFQGSIVLGMGFTLTHEDASRLISQNEMNQKVIFPYINGQDVNQSQDQSPSRMVINFFDWPLERVDRSIWDGADNKTRTQWEKEGRVSPDYSGPVARDFPDCIKIVEEKVKPERALVKREARRIWWWQYAEHSPGLRKAIENLKRVLVVPLVSKYVNAVWLPNNYVYTHKLAVFADSSEKMFALIQSTHHALWVRKYSSTLKTDINYSPSDCFENFPIPSGGVDADLINKYENQRRKICQTRNLGITQVYNLFHDPRCVNDDILLLRTLHIALDNEVSALFGINESLEYDFFDGDDRVQSSMGNIGRSVRFTVSPRDRDLILNRIREVNNAFYKTEVSEGLHEKSKKNKKSKIEAIGQATTQKQLELKPQVEQPKLF